MAKIGYISPLIDGQRVRIDTYYTHARGFHIKALPAGVAELANESRLGGYASERELEHAVAVIVDSYHARKRRTRKVIVYSLSLTTELAMNRVRRTKYGGREFEGYKSWLPKGVRASSSGFGDNGRGFALEWEVFMEVTGEDGVVYHYLGDDGSIGTRAHRHDNTDLVVEWTPEREAALKEIDAAMERMVKKIALLMGNTEKFAALLDNGVKLLPETTTNRKEGKP